MIALFAGHRTAANIAMIAIAGLGLMALPSLQRDTFPATPPSDVSVRITYPGAAPSEVETGICTVTDPVLTRVENLAKLTCLARDNSAQITAEMIEGADMTRFYNDIKDAVDGINSFPDKADDPVVQIVERTASVSSVAVTGPDDPAVLYAYAQSFADQLRADPAISLVSVNGFSDREIAIEFDRAALERFGLDMGSVGATLARYSLDMPAGSLEGRSGEVAIRFLGERRTPAELAQIPIAGSAAGGEVRLGDVATIREGFADPSQATYFDGKRAAIVSVQKTASQDALRVRAALDREMAQAQAEAPGNIQLAISADSTRNIVERLRIIGVNGLQGLILVLVAMWLFFGLRMSFWVAMGLPISFLGAIFAMQFLGYTINMMTMVALLVATGLLMDDAIVISENIVRRRQTGEPARVAAVKGTMQVFPGVLASFLTTAMVIGPLSFLTGNIGALLKYIPIVLLITLTVSLIEAFLILPAHMRHSLKHDMRPGPVQRAVNGAFERLRDRVIVPLAGVALRWRYLTLGLAILLVSLSVAPFTGGFLKYQSFPTLESDTVEARLLLPAGAPLSLTEARVSKVVKALKEMDAELSPAQPDGQPLVRSYTITYGSNADSPTTGPNMATVSASLLPAGTRTTDVGTVLDRWKQLVGKMPDMAAFRITDKERGAGGKPIDLLVTGPDLAELATTARELRRFFRGFDGVRDVTFDLQPGKPELVVRMKPAVANLLGVTPAALASELRAAFRGDSAVSFADARGQVDIVARLAPSERRAIGDVLALRVPGKNGALVPLSAVATVSETRGYTTITHVNGQRAVSVQGTIDPTRANSRELMAAMRADYLPELAQKRPDVKVQVLGEEQDTATTGASLVRFMTAGAIGVYLLLAFYMGSFIRPVAVIATIPLSLIGVMWGHVLLGLPLSLPSLVGLATLAGVVVNDAILLDAFIGERRATGTPMLEAGKEAVRDRFRAIFLTSLTTVVGLGPLLLETSTQAQFLRPIVASLAFGLSAATVLSLFVTPAILAVLEDFGIRTADPEPEETAPSVEHPADALRV
ncbi:efflux RND transporter permease subunit [Thioclava sp. JE_KL1]|uniref:efflux RND transporter permease subunit n=1 Tax=Thioclava sp. JE_KL1 TaxID=2651187 RepID=UPI00128AECAF|nr:efflux RND transporter permease subunit [Thioclava sp. JE_KL1]MPQ93371.1 efflux RND transporter permease subunit [Thioclava sp. JE_KL1]